MRVKGSREIVTILNDQYTDLTGISSPSSPASGNLRIYSKTDGRVYAKNSNGIENVIGPVNDNVKNYLGTLTTSNGSNSGNGNFEIGATTGWSLAHSSLTGAFPSSVGTGGAAFSSSNGGSSASANLSISAITSGRLSGSYSMSYASSAATTAGDMVISNAFFIDTEDQAKMMTVKFYYKANSGASNCNFSGTSSNSFGVAIYDVSNNAWIQPAGVFNLVQSSGTGYCTATFQTSSNGTSYQLAVYNANATSGAATLYLDDFSVSPQTAPSGPAVGDWVSYTPTISGFGTGASSVAYWRRVGANMEIKATIQHGSSISGQKNIQLPSGYTGNSATIVPWGTVSGAAYGTIGYASYDQAASPYTGYSGIALLSLSDLKTILFASDSANSQGSAWNQTLPMTSAANDTVDVTVSVPILGWSSNCVMSSDTDTRVIAAKANSCSTSFASGSTTTAIFSSTEYDTSGSYNTSTGVYTVPVSGMYRISACIVTSGAVTPAAFPSHTDLVLNYNNGVVSQYFGLVQYNGSGSVIPTLYGSITYKCNAGDTLRLQVSNSNIAWTGNGNPNCWISFERLSGPAVVAATETVAAKYYASANGSATQTQMINYDTKIYDSHGAVTAGAAGNNSWKFTAPVSGKYMISGYVTNSSSVPAGGCTMQIYKNGSALDALSLFNGTIANGTLGSTTVQLLAGDYIDVRSAGGNTYPWLGGTYPQVGNNDPCRIEIIKVANY